MAIVDNNPNLQNGGSNLNNAGMVDGLEHTNDLKHPKQRATWGKKIEFILSAISYAVGLGNVWRFPHLCYKNGGGAFLIPYLIMLIFAGLPLFFLELAFGQYASLGPITIWKMAPIFKGLGYTMMFTSLIVSTYYNVILALTFFYFFASFTKELPWAKCGNWWNTQNCVERRHHGGYYEVISDNSYQAYDNYTTSISPNTTEDYATTTLLPQDRGHHENNTQLTPWPHNITSPAEEFWKYYVQGLTDDTNIGNLGHPQWKLVICLFLAWVVVFLCIAKGIKSSGKVVYFTATFPYFVLSILLIRGVTLDGAIDGIKFYLTPDFKKMAHAQVWKDAAVQIFYSLGIGFGTLLTLGSYNKFHNNCHRDAIMVALINCGTSVFAGFVIFSVLGFMAYESGLPVKSVVDDGPGLAFIAYPEALAMLPGAPFWSILFFFMLMTLGLGSQFPSMECIMTGFTDEFPRLRPYKMWLTLTACIVLFFCGIPCVTQGGMYVVELMDTFTTSFPLLIVALSECMVISYVYGFRRFSSDIEIMMGFRPSYYWVACWLVCTPLVIIFVLVFSCIEYDGLEYNNYKYPPWAEFIGWVMVLIALGMIPGCAIIKFWKQIESCHNLFWIFRGPAAIKTLKLIELIRPTEDWGPALEENKTKVEHHQVQYHRENDMVNILDITAVEDTTTEHNTTANSVDEHDENKTILNPKVIQQHSNYTNPGDSYI